MTIYEILTREKLPTNTQISVEKLLKIGTFFWSKMNEYNYKKMQITKYDWLEQEELDIFMKRLSKKLNKKNELIFEKSVSSQIPIFDRIITGNIDCIDETKKEVWELKCTTKIEKEHLLQLAIYMFLYTQNEVQNQNENYKYYLWNILTNEMLEIKSTPEKLTEMVKYLIYMKYEYNYDIDDKTFLNEMLKIKEKYF